MGKIGLFFLRIKTELNKIQIGPPLIVLVTGSVSKNNFSIINI